MRALLRCCLIALLIASLVESPLLASPSLALGIVMDAQRARVGSGEAVDGATVFDGDTLTTDSGGRLRLRIGAARLSLLADSAAALHQTKGAVSAALERGTIVFSSTDPGAIELHASEARMRPRTAQLTLAQVTLLGPYEFLVTCQLGQLEVAIGDEIHTVPEATSYRVVIDPEKKKDENGSGAPPLPAARSRFTLVVLIAIAAVTAIAVWRSLVSPDKP